MQPMALLRHMTNDTRPYTHHLEPWEAWHVVVILCTFMWLIMVTCNTIFSLLREAISPERVSSQERQPSGKELLRYKNHTKLQMRIISLPKLKEGQILVLIGLYNKNTGSCKPPIVPCIGNAWIFSFLHFLRGEGFFYPHYLFFS